MRIIIVEKVWNVPFPNRLHGIDAQMTQVGPTSLFNKGPLKFHLWTFGRPFYGDEAVPPSSY